MENSKVFLASLLKTLQVLEPYLGEVIVCGGWVPILYRRYGQVPSQHPLLLTKDIDVVVPRRLVQSGRPTIDELLRQAGYEARSYGSEVATVTKYELSDPQTQVEFLTPEVGPPGKSCVFVQNQLAAQPLRYMSILLENVRELRVSDELSGTAIHLNVRVPLPAAFVYQKGVSLHRRGSKVAKDLYYIFDLLDSSPEMHTSILTDMALLREHHPTSWFRTLLHNLERFFPEDNGEGPMLIASQYSGAMPIPTFRRYTHRVVRGFLQGLHALAQ